MPALGRMWPSRTFTVCHHACSQQDLGAKGKDRPRIIPRPQGSPAATSGDDGTDGKCSQTNNLAEQEQAPLLPQASDPTFAPPLGFAVSTQNLLQERCPAHSVALLARQHHQPPSVVARGPEEHSHVPTGDELPPVPCSPRHHRDPRCCKWAPQGRPLLRPLTKGRRRGTPHGRRCNKFLGCLVQPPRSGPQLSLPACPPLPESPMGPRRACLLL